MSEIIDKSTPISNLNLNDETPVLQKILDKFDNLQQENSMQQIENDFENRKIDNSIYERNINNVEYQQHFKNKDNNEEELYEEYIDEYENMSLFKRILYDIKPIVIITLMCILIFNSTTNKLLISKINIFCNKFNECNIIGLIVKSIFVAVLSYLAIRYINF